MTIASKSTRPIAAAAAAVTVGLALTACGPVSTNTIVKPAIGDHTAFTGSDPIDVSITLDSHAFVGRPELATGYRDAALRAAAPAIEQGGHLRVTAFGAVADRAELVLDTAIPGLGELDELQRVEAEEGARADLAAGLDIVLGLSDAAPDATKRVEENASGADVARAVRAAVRAVRPVVRRGKRGGRAGQATNPAVVVVISPGLNDTPELVLEDDLRSTSPVKLAADLRRLMGRADTVDILRFVGVGQTGIGDGLDAADTDRLVKTWRTACRSTGADSCPITRGL